MIVPLSTLFILAVVFLLPSLLRCALLLVSLRGTLLMLYCRLLLPLLMRGATLLWNGVHRRRSLMVLLLLRASRLRPSLFPLGGH